MNYTKQDFVETMQRLQAFYNDLNEAETALRKLNPDNYFFFPEPFEIVVDTLIKVFDDKDDWILYFLYDCDYIVKCSEVKIQDSVYGTITISNWEDVYDLLVQE